MAATSTAAFTIASPAFRYLGMDVMLEAPGAALSALALYLYARACDALGDRSRWRWAALTLTALFFLKGNYWGLVVAALLLAWLSENKVDWSGSIARLRNFAPTSSSDPLFAIR